MKSFRHWASSLCGISLVSLFAVSAPAATITGTLGFFGPGVLTFSTGGGAPGTNFIDWCPVNSGPEPGANCGTATTGAGDGLTFVSSTSGSFTAFNPFLSTGTILDITDDPTATGNPYTYIPLGPTSIANFLDFADPWDYTLTEIENQNCAATATELCTGYFKLVQVGSSVSVNLSGKGFITAGPDDNPFKLLITGNFADTTIAQVIAAATTSGGIFSNSWSGELVATGAAIPEPGTIGLGLLGFAMIATGAVRRRNKA